MATNTVNGILVCSDGTNIPLKAEIAEGGTNTSLTTDTVYSVTAQEVGDFAPGKTVTSGLVTCDAGVAFAYLLRQGVVAAIIPVAVKGVSAFTPALCAPITLMAGDKIIVQNNTAADREGALCVYTASGVSRIFSVTPSGSGTSELVDIQTLNKIGDTLQGQTIVKAFFTTIDGSKIETPGAVVVDSLNNVVGSVSATDPSKYQPLFSSCSIPVDLNFKAQYLLNA
jgi:hypothetical protein